VGEAGSAASACTRDQRAESSLDGVKSKDESAEGLLHRPEVGCRFLPPFPELRLADGPLKGLKRACTR
jgi:hypothetical protein